MTTSHAHGTVYESERAFFAGLARLAAPIALHTFLLTSLNFIDTVMIGRLGEVEIAAVAIANQLFFLFMLYLFGVGSAATIFTAQYWGRRDLAGVRRTVGAALVPSALGAAVFFTAAAVFPQQVFGVFTNDVRVVALGVGYLRAIAPSYFATAASVLFAAVMRSTGNAKLPLQVSAVSIALNAVLNWLLIFGVGPFPALGVLGAALATTIARIGEAVVLVRLAFRRREPLAGTPGEWFSFDRGFLRLYWKTSVPVLLNEIGWAGGMTAYVAVFARMGTEIVAAYNIADVVFRLLFVVFIGSGSATAVLIGNTIGAGQPDAAQRRARAIMIAAPVLGLAIGLVAVGLAPLVPRLYAVAPEVRASVTRIMLVFVFIAPLKVVNLHIVVGLLRSGGDTVFSLVVDVGILWLVGVPLVAVAGLQWGLAPELVFLCTGIEELVKLVAGVPRILSGRWINDLATPRRSDPVPPATSAATG